MKTALTLCLAGLLGACATTTGVHPTGGDALSITVDASPARGGEAAARQIAMKEATEHCAPRAVQVAREVVPEHSVWSTTMHTVVLDFKCVAA